MPSAQVKLYIYKLFRRLESADSPHTLSYPLLNHFLIAISKACPYEYVFLVSPLLEREGGSWLFD